MNIVPIQKDYLLLFLSFLALTILLLYIIPFGWHWLLVVTFLGGIAYLLVKFGRKYVVDSHA